MADIKFGTDGWRGIIADTFTFRNLEIVAQATATYVKKNKWPYDVGAFIGYDTRFFSELFAKRVAQVFAANEIKTFISKTYVPTPFVTFEIRQKRAGFGVSITASHNPYQYNGYKLRTPKGGAASVDITASLESLIGETPKVLDFDKAVSEEYVEEVDVYPRYLEWVREKVDVNLIRSRNYNLIVDPMHGASSNLLERILNVDVKFINLNRDAFFGFRHPEPIEKNIKELIQLVKDGGFDLGVATDGDGDRVGMVDEKGNFVNPHQIFSLIYLHLLKNRGIKGDVAKTISTTSLIFRIAEDYGMKVHETPVGFKYITDMLSDGVVIAGGEESGGIGVVFHIPERDGVFSALMVMEMMAYEGKKLSELVESLWNTYGYHVFKRIDVSVPHVDIARELVEKLSADPPDKVAGISVDKVLSIDGVKFVLKDGSWILFRASGTEPLLRVYCETHSDERIGLLLDEGRQIVERYIA